GGPEQPLRVGGIRRLRIYAASEHNCGVAPEHGTLPGLCDHGARLLTRVSADELDGVSSLRVLFVEPRRNDVERNPELLENRPPLRRRRREHERLRWRSVSHVSARPRSLPRATAGPT